MHFTKTVNRRRTRAVQWHSPGCANVHPPSTPQLASAPYRCYPLLSLFEYIDSRRCPGMSWACSFVPSKLPFRVRSSGPPSNTWFLAPTQDHIPNGISISLVVFTQITADSPYTLQWAATYPLKIVPSYGDMDMFLGPIRGNIPNCIMIVWLLLRGSRSRETDRQTDYATPSVAIGLI